MLLLEWNIERNEFEERINRLIEENKTGTADDGKKDKSKRKKTKRNKLIRFGVEVTFLLLRL